MWQQLLLVFLLVKQIHSKIAQKQSDNIQTRMVLEQKDNEMINYLIVGK